MSSFNKKVRRHAKSKKQNIEEEKPGIRTILKCHKDLGMTRHGIQNHYDEYARSSSGKVNNVQESMGNTRKEMETQKESNRNVS